jgi:uncharacterized protein (TIGR00297 family)
MPEINAITAYLAGSSPATRLGIALAVTLIFAILGRLVRGVTVSGAIAGWIVSFAIFAGAGPGAFAALVMVFSVTWLATRVGYRHKLRLGTAEKKDGRTALQVLANLAVAGVCAAAYALLGRNAALLAALAAALSEAAADTVSSELGQATSDQARLITNWQKVPAGTDGGVTWLGTLAGVATAILISLTCFVAGLLPTREIAIPAAAAIAGMLADSLLGAVLERRNLLNNDGVNLCGTAIAAALAFFLA